MAGKARSVPPHRPTFAGHIDRWNLRVLLMNSDDAASQREIEKFVDTWLRERGQYPTELYASAVRISAKAVGVTLESTQAEHRRYRHFEMRLGDDDEFPITLFETPASARSTRFLAVCADLWDIDFARVEEDVAYVLGVVLPALDYQASLEGGRSILRTLLRKHVNGRWRQRPPCDTPPEYVGSAGPRRQAAQPPPSPSDRPGSLR
jgi:hypothetical protein